MKRMILAITVLAFGVVTTAPADYILIVANVGQRGAKAELQNNPQPGAVPGIPPVTVPIQGQQPGTQPAIGPGGFRGGPPPGTTPNPEGENSPRGGPTPPGAPADPTVGPAAAPFDPDLVPTMILAIVDTADKINRGSALQLRLGGSINAKFKLGNVDAKMPLGNTTIATIIPLHPNDKPTLSLGEIYAQKLKVLSESKAATAEQWIDFAEWCLAHGRLAQFKEQMEKAVAIDKSAPKAAAYLQMKAALAKPVESIDTAGPWRKQMLSTRYQTTNTAHYAILSNDPVATDSRKNRLEGALETYYYWFAMHGLQLPVPSRRLVAILSSERKEFEHAISVLDSTPTVSDSFYARRENIAVFSTKRLDDGYDRLNKLYTPLGGQGFQKDLLLKGQGYPRNLLLQGRGAEVREAMTLALLLKVMDVDGEVSGTGHGATRQLIYSSGFLPAGVAAPEWVQFGVSSFFETSPGSPWQTVGLPSFEYGPLFKELGTARKLPPDPLDLLKKVVTDDYFRNPSESLKKEASLRNARATSWSLCYFLIRKRMDGLQRYFNELSQLPRDLILDEQTLWLTFAKAFNAVDATGQPDLNVLRTLADDWDKDLKLDQWDNREIELMRTIRLAYQQAAMAQLMAPVAGTPGVGIPGAIPPGARPGVGGGAPFGGGAGGRPGRGGPAGAGGTN